MIVLLLLVTLAGISSWGASIAYRDYASKRGLTAKINHRTLHARETPKGGGLIITLIANFFVYLAWYLQVIDDYRTLQIFIVGLLISIFGYMDDIKNIKAPIKLFFQLIF